MKKKKKFVVFEIIYYLNNFNQINFIKIYFYIHLIRYIKIIKK